MNKLVFSVFTKYYFFSAILIPNFYQYLNTRGAIFLNALLMLMPLTFFILARRDEFVISIKRNAALFVFSSLQLLFFANICLGMLVGLVSSGNDLHYRDFFEFHRPIYNLIIFSMFYLLANQHWEKIKIDKTIDAAFLIIALHGVLQYIQIMEPISLSFVKETNFNTGRISAPFPNPYDFGFVMLFFCLYYFWEWRHSKKLIPLKFLAGSVLLLLTQSRSIALSYLLIFVLLMPVSSIFSLIFRKGKGSFKSLYLFVGLFVFGAFFIFQFGESLQYLIAGMKKIVSNPLDNGVSSARIEQFMYALNYGPSNYFQLLLGNGPSKGTMDDVESIYTYYIFRYGFFGLIFGFFAILILGIFFCQKIIKHGVREHKSTVQFRAFQLWLLVLPLCSFGSNHTEQIRVSFLHLAMIGLIYGRYDGLLNGRRN